jgi:hypothetical protein
MVILIFLMAVIPIMGQQGEWFPKELNIHPFTANVLEPAAGFSYMAGKSGIQLDIGTSEDLYHYRRGDEVFSIGADLFTYTRLRGESDFHFPVETIDYLFGVNAGYKSYKGRSEYGLRFRLSHISAHLVDGQFDADNGWRNGQLPRVYSREFIELFPYYRYDGLRGYLGFTYLFHSNPEDVGKGMYQAGFDYYLKDMISACVSPYIAYDFRLFKVTALTGNNVVSAGIKFGDFSSKGIRVYYKYISGMSIHGEFYDKYESYSSIGVNLDF